MKRNACVDCEHYLCAISEDDGCDHPAYKVKGYDRVSGTSFNASPSCMEIRRAQPTDACPHWEAKQ